MNHHHDKHIHEGIQYELWLFSNSVILWLIRIWGRRGQLIMCQCQNTKVYAKLLQVPLNVLS